MPVPVARRCLAHAALLAFLLAAAPAHALEVGAGDAAQPALRRVGVPESGTPGAITAAADASGGVTEGLGDSDSAHARLALRVAAAVDATRWLKFGAWLHGRYDLHPRDSRGRDDGFLLQPQVSARLAWRSGALGYGFEGSAWLPAGADVGASLAALSADGRALLSVQRSRLLVAGYAGYRLDRSAKTAGDLARLRFGDRTALGVSDYDALLVGVGLGYAAGRTLLFGEVAAQLLLASPQLAASPLWLSMGVRRPFGPAGLSGEVSLDALASARPELSTGSALFPIEPRVTLNFGLRYRFGEHTPLAPVVKVEPKPERVKPVTPAAPPPTSVELELLDDRGQPLQRAQVTVRQGETVTPLVETAPGRYRLDGAHPGRARLRVKAEGFQAVERDIDVSSGQTARVDVKVEQALPAGQVRGLVRSFRGKRLAATIRLEPGGATTSTDPEGFFEIDVPPGEYEASIESPGYKAQRRKAKVEQQGVVILNVDLSQ